MPTIGGIHISKIWMDNILAMVNTEWTRQIETKVLKCAVSGSTLQKLSDEIDDLESISIANDTDQAIARYAATHSTPSEARPMIDAIITASMFLEPVQRYPIFDGRSHYPLVRTTAGRLYERARDWFTLMRQTHKMSSIDFLVSFETASDGSTNYHDYVSLTVFMDFQSWKPDELPFYVQSLRSFTSSRKSITTYRNWIVHVLEESVRDAGPDTKHPDCQIEFRVETSLSAELVRREFEDGRCCGIAAVIDTYTYTVEVEHDDEHLADMLRAFLVWLERERTRWAEFRTRLTSLYGLAEVQGDRRDENDEVRLLPYVKHSGRPESFAARCQVCNCLPTMSYSP